MKIKLASIILGVLPFLYTNATIANDETSVPFICQNLDSNELLMSCINQFNNLVNKEPNAIGVNGTSYSCMRNPGCSVDEEKLELLSHFYNQNFQYFVTQYESLAMNYWSRDKTKSQNQFDFKSAKHYVDNFDNLYDLLPLVQEPQFTFEPIVIDIKDIDTEGLSDLFPSNNGREDNITLILKHKDDPLSLIHGIDRTPMIESRSSIRWHFTRQGLRFYENTLRTRHNSLCKTRFHCLSDAWDLYSLAISRKFYEDYLGSRIQNHPLNYQLSNLYSDLQTLKAQNALLIIAEDEKYFTDTSVLRRSIENKIKKTQHDINEIFPEFSSIEEASKLNLAQTQDLLVNSENLLVFAESLNCRPYVSWLVNSEDINLNLTNSIGNECDAYAVKEQIKLLSTLSSKNTDFNQINSILKNLSEILLPRSILKKQLPLGSTIYVIPDETMAGLPFERLPIDDSALGDLYNIKYVPSPFYLAILKSKPTQATSIPYYVITQGNPSVLTSPPLELKEFAIRKANYMNGSGITNATISDILNQENKQNLENARVVQFIAHGYDTLHTQSLLFDEHLTDDVIIDNNFDLKADVVLLTACKSSGDESIEIGESLSSLSRAFLTSGAHHVIVSRWLVDEENVKEFTSYFLDEYKKSQDVDKAYNYAIKTLKVNFPDKPSHWSGWMLIGS